jgi:hypothetical protein
MDTVNRVSNRNVYWLKKDDRERHKIIPHSILYIAYCGECAKHKRIYY